MNERANILGVMIDRLDLPEARQRIAYFVDSGRPYQIVTVNLDFISKARRNPAFKELINTSDMVVCDGMPIVWASRLMGEPIPQRVTGVELLHACCRMAQDRNHSVFLLGAAPSVAAEASNVLTELYTDLRIAGTYSPPFGEFSAEENKRMVDIVSGSGAQYLFVAFGCPKQDFWIREHMEELGVPVCIGVGGTFNYLTGRIKRAPVWAQNLGCEWLFRLVQEPNRLAKRYLVDDLPVLFEMFSHKFTSSNSKAPKIASRS